MTSSLTKSGLSTLTRVNHWAKLGSVNMSASATDSPTSQSRSERRQGQTGLDEGSNLKGAANLASMKKGPGYRSSFSGVVATVFGASGCIGRAVCNRLGKNGSQLILPYRGDHYHYMRLKVVGDLGQVLFTPFHLKDEESIRLAMTYSNVVINLIGSDTPTRNFSFEDVNVTGPARIARIAKECGVKSFVHISHINAREEPARVFLPNGSEFLSTKWRGEQAVFEAFPEATIFRPTDVYGKGASFLRHYFSFFRQGGRKSLPLWKKGEETVKAPLFFSDLASGIMNSISDPEARGQIYEAYGPERYLLSDLVDWMYAKTNRDPIVYGYRRTDLRFSPSVFLQAYLLQNLPIGNKWLGGHSLEKLERHALSDEILGLPSLYDLGVQPARIVEKMPFELEIFKQYAYHKPESIEEDIQVHDPIPLSRLDVEKVLAKTKSTTPFALL